MNRRQIAVIVAVSLALLAVPAALAGKGAGAAGKPTGGGGGTSNSLTGPTMVVDNNRDGTPNWNDQVTFNVSSSASKPYVRLNCYQSGAWVSTATGGFFPESPWAPNFTLSSSGWTSGAADCTATLYTVSSNGKTQDLANLGFHVAA